jgi:hypothetical protein
MVDGRVWKRDDPVGPMEKARRTGCLRIGVVAEVDPRAEALAPFIYP